MTTIGEYNDRSRIYDEGGLGRSVKQFARGSRGATPGEFEVLKSPDCIFSILVTENYNATGVGELQQETVIP